MSRNKILAAIRNHTASMQVAPLPDRLEIYESQKPDLHTSATQFAKAVQAAGGECIDLSHSSGTISGSKISNVEDYFNGHTPEILHAHFAVIENGACWIDHHCTDDRTRYTLPEHLAIFVPNNTLVPTMHEAYAHIQALGIEDFGLFLSGPSKTADIEQSLVLGAQGAMVTKVFLI